MFRCLPPALLVHQYLQRRKQEMAKGVVHKLGHCPALPRRQPKYIEDLLGNPADKKIFHKACRAETER